MTQDPIEELDPRSHHALNELRNIIHQRYPTATFSVSTRHDELDALHLTVTIVLDDVDEVLDLVVDRVVDLQVDEGIPVHVIPVRTLEAAAVRDDSRQARTIVSARRSGSESL
jgi:hypothetical protein